MPTPKARNVSVEVPQRMSPSMQTSQKASPSANQASRRPKITRVGSDSGASPNSLSRTPKNRSPRVPERGSPNNPMTEKKRVSKLPDLESHLSQLEDELKKTKDQLISSDTLKHRALQESEETKKQLAIMSARLEELHQQLNEFSNSEDTRVQELQKLSHERDRVWQSEVEAIQKQHSVDSVALASALNEIQKLKRQLEMARNAETAHAEIECLRVELSETVSLVENMRKQLSDYKRSEVQALQVARETQMQLEEAMRVAESLRSEEAKAKEAYDSLTLELEKSKEETSSLEILVKELEKKLQELDERGKKEEATDTGEVEAELDLLRLEVDRLKSALEASELRYQEGYIQSTLQIRNAYDQVEHTKSETGVREAELEVELKKARTTIDELKLELLFKETMVQKNPADTEICTERSEFEMELKILKGDLQDLKAVLSDKEFQIQSKTEENEMLKDSATSAETAKAAEREALMTLGHLTEEAERSIRQVARVEGQLDAAQKANTELEAELRKLKIQSDQWRKAAEAAASMLSSEGSNGGFVDRTVSFDSSCNSIATKMESPLSDDADEEFLKKKNVNVLKKFGVLWKKGQK